MCIILWVIATTCTTLIYLFLTHSTDWKQKKICWPFQSKRTMQGVYKFTGKSRKLVCIQAPLGMHAKLSFHLCSGNMYIYIILFLYDIHLQIISLLVCHKEEGENETTALPIVPEVCTFCSEELSGSRLTFCTAMNVRVPGPLANKRRISLAKTGLTLSIEIINKQNKDSYISTHAQDWAYTAQNCAPGSHSV